MRHYPKRLQNSQTNYLSTSSTSISGTFNSNGCNSRDVLYMHEDQLNSSTLSFVTSFNKDCLNCPTEAPQSSIMNSGIKLQDKEPGI